MFWAWSTVAIILLAASGGWLTLDGLAGSMSDVPVESSGRYFVYGLMLCGAALILFCVQIFVWVRG